MADFDRVARWYRAAEYLAMGRWLERTREFFLPELPAAETILLLGDGDGRFTARLLQRMPSARATAVDTSAEMLRLLRLRCERVGRQIETVCGSALRYEPDVGPELVVTHFFLDCLTEEEVRGLAERMAETCRPGCVWLVSDFAVPRRQPWRLLGRGYIWLLYVAFGWLAGLRVRQLPPIEKALVAAGFRRRRRREFLAGLLFTEIWELCGGASDPGAVFVR